MTEREFENDLLPVLAGRWKGMVTRYPKGADDYGRKVADEANLYIWEALGTFQIDSAIEAARAVSRRIPCLPDKKSYKWLVQEIRSAINGMIREQRADMWTWEDECTLWHIVADFVRRGAAYDEVEVARQYLGKNPSIDERDEAYKVLCKHVDEVRDRSIKRQARSEEEAKTAYPYPRQAIEVMKHEREEWQKRYDAAMECRDVQSELAGLLG